MSNPAHMTEAQATRELDRLLAQFEELAITGIRALYAEANGDETAAPTMRTIRRVAPPLMDRIEELENFLYN